MRLELTCSTRLELGPRIAEGAQGCVHHALWLNNRLSVAVKMVSEEPAISAVRERSRRATLQREGELLKTLPPSPRVVRLFVTGVDPSGRPVLVMEQLAGNLKDAVLMHGPLAPRLALRYTGQVARGLTHLHRHGLRHLDLKPSNVLLTPTTTDLVRAKIGDLGIAMKDEHSTHGRLGTPGWMSPEQVIAESNQGNRSIYRTSGAADYHALGRLLFFMVTGRNPRLGPTIKRRSGVRDHGSLSAQLADWALRLADRQRLELHLQQAIDACSSARDQKQARDDAKIVRGLVTGLLSSWPADRLPAAHQAVALQAW